MTSALAVESKCHDPFRHDPQLGQLRPGERHVVFLPLRCKDSRSRVKTPSTQAKSSSLILPKNSLRTDAACPGVARRSVSNPAAVNTAREPRPSSGSGSRTAKPRLVVELTR